MSDSTLNGLFPVASFYFRINIDGIDMAFSEASGFDIETEVLEYRSGDSPEFSKIKLPGLRKYNNATFKKGIYVSDERIINLFGDGAKYRGEQGVRFDVLVSLLDSNGDVVREWTLMRAFPVKTGDLNLKSDGNEVALESLELAYDKVVINHGSASTL